MTADTPAIRVLVADDHAVVRRGIGALLTSLPGIEVVAEASTGGQALREAQLTRPDVVIMDLQMPDLDGIEATRRLRVLLPRVAVLVLTMFEDDDSVLAAMRAGARGYLLKGAEQDDLLAAVRAVVAGQLVIGPGVAERLVGYLHTPAPPSGALAELTQRERDVLTRAALGETNTAIAAALGMAAKTVANHVSAILAKLRVSSRAEAVEIARRDGLGRPGESPAVVRDHDLKP